MRGPLGRLAPARRRQAVVLLAGVVLVAGGVLGWTLLRPGTTGADQAVPGPVVLVAGYGGDVSRLAPIESQLRAEGRETAVLRQGDGGTGDLGAQAEELGRLVEQVLSSTGAPSVDLVGYSAGGVVARLYVRELDGADVVRRVVTVGSPHHGSDAAELALQAAGTCPPACEQLAPDSDLLRALNAGDETPDGPRWVTLRSSADDVVRPTDSALLEGADNVLVQDLCPDAGTTHSELPGDPVTAATLAATLGAGEPAGPTRVDC